MSEPADNGPHYGRLTCLDCGVFLKWIGKPRTHWTGLELPEPWTPGTQLPELRGTPGQVRFADSVRRPILRRAWRRGGAYRHLSLCMATIDDATWWLANRLAPSVDEMKWPDSWTPVVPPLTYGERYV